MMRHVTAAIVTRSELVYNGLLSMLHKNPDLSVSFVKVNRNEPLSKVISAGDISLVFIDLQSVSTDEAISVRDACGESVKLVLLQTALVPDDTLKLFDAVVSLYDGHGAITEKIKGLYSDENSSDRQNELTTREREIVVGVVKGLSNKEIASEMNISAHTVMTHRRNIAAKLEIHSAAGLTIYALARKLVTLEEVSRP